VNLVDDRIETFGGAADGRYERTAAFSGDEPILSPLFEPPLTASEIIRR
jgi:ABC-type cobalt transport system substrate-binding protein